MTVTATASSSSPTPQQTTDAVVPEPDGTTQSEDVGAGQPYPVAGVTITAKAVDCTRTIIPDVAGVDGPSDYKADSGDVFCVITGTFTNTSTVPRKVGPPLDVVMAADGTQYASSDKDGDAAAALCDAEKCGHPNFFLNSPMNPGKTWPFTAVYQIPKGVKISSTVLVDDDKASIGLMPLPAPLM